MTPAATAVVLTVGNEIVFGDVENTNASWLARRLAELGLEVRLLAAVRDSVDEVAEFLRAEMERTGASKRTSSPSSASRRASQDAFVFSTSPKTISFPTVRTTAVAAGVMRASIGRR